jgi:serine phosphatase RsbU (regulator of sigma subunit)
MAKSYDVIEGARVAAEQALGHLSGRPDAVLFFSCSARKHVLGSRTNREINAAQAVFGANVPMAGFYAYGEIANCGTTDPKCRFHNETATFLALREPSASGDSLSASNADILDPEIDESEVRIEVLEDALAGAERQNDVLEKFCFGLEQEHKKAKDELSNAYTIIKAQKQRMEDELNVGRDIQMSMLPKKFPDFPEHGDFDLHALLVPAREVAGDFFDCFALDENKLCFCVGDVSGKGVPAALFMAMSKNMLSVMAQEVPSPAKIVTLTNDKISSDNRSSMFVTLFIGIYNLETQDLHFTNAGHNPPLLRRKNGDVEVLKQIHGPVIGAMDGIEYNEDKNQINTGDTLLVFTDGVTEAMNRDGGFYGNDRLFQLFSASNFDTAESLTAEVLSSVEKFAVDTEQADDITILALKPD